MNATTPILHKKSGLTFTALGFGAATQGGLYRAVADAEAQAAFAHIWERGIRYLDTAPWYGYGQSEQRLGQFLQGRSGYVLSTKVGRLLREGVPPHPTQFNSTGEKEFKNNSPYNVVYDYSYDGFMRSFEESLVRLGTNHIDLLLIHDPDQVGVSVQEVMKGGYRALQELRQQGVVRAIGAGMNQWQMPLEFAQSGDFDVFLLASRYTLLEQGSLAFMDYCASQGIGVVIGGVFNSGLLADPQPGARYDYRTVPGDILNRTQHIQRLCQRHGVAIKAAALQFPLGHPAVVSVLMASRSVEQLEQNYRAFEAPIPPELWQALKAQGLMAQEAPVEIRP
jgi:D-threo-aldose 1-dehydrogenase